MFRLTREYIRRRVSVLADWRWRVHCRLDLHRQSWKVDQMTTRMATRAGRWRWWWMTICHHHHRPAILHCLPYLPPPFSFAIIVRPPSSSAAAPIVCNPRLPLSTSAIVLVIHHCRPSVCQKSAPLHFTHYIPRFSPQNLSTIYPLEHPHIHISAYLHFTIAQIRFLVLKWTCHAGMFWGVYNYRQLPKSIENL